jgi:DNA mismatch endonuclease, patch repair protein
MADVVSSETRSRMMSGIRSKDTKPEQLVRKALFAAGFRFRLHRRNLPGVPDVVLPGRRVAIFVHGCFWHLHRECQYAKIPSTRPDFWRKKLEGNAQRDRRNVEALIALGWRVLVVWECATKKNVVGLQEALVAWIGGGETRGELSGGTTYASADLIVGYNGLLPPNTTECCQRSLRLQGSR